MRNFLILALFFDSFLQFNIYTLVHAELYHTTDSFLSFEIADFFMSLE